MNGERIAAWICNRVHQKHAVVEIETKPNCIKSCSIQKI